MECLTLQTLTTTQAKYDAMVYPQPPGTATGVTMGDILGLLVQAFQDTQAVAPIVLTATTNASGTATVNLTSYGFTAAPFVQLTPVNATTSTSVVANITSVSSTSLVIQTNISQNVLLGIINPFTPVSTTVHITLIA
jgi:hypothetical protein